jgi:lipopolysaccharide export system protein LptA
MIIERLVFFRMKLKVLFITTLLLVILTATVAAKPVITADSTYFDINTGQYILSGNVHIEVGSRVITAGNAKVSMISKEVWGSDGVTVTQGDIYFTGNTVYVNGNQNTAQIDGGVSFSRNDLQITANNVEYNWRTKLASFNGNVQVTQNGNTWTTNTLTYDLRANTIL